MANCASAYENQAVALVVQNAGSFTVTASTMMAYKERMWNFCGSRIGEVEEDKYIGVRVKSRLNCGFKSVGIEWLVKMEYLV